MSSIKQLGDVATQGAALHEPYAREAMAYEQAGEFRTAMAIHLKHLNDPERALACVQQDGNLLYGANLFARFGYDTLALDLYRRCINNLDIERVFGRTTKYKDLKDLLVWRGTKEEQLAIYQLRKNVAKCFEVLEDLPVTYEEAKCYYDAGKYFLAFIRLVCLKEWVLAGHCAIKLRKYAEAADLYLKAGMSYEAGLAYRKTGDAKQALRLILATDHGAPKFKGAGSLVKRLGDRKWLEDLAHSLMARKEWKQAAWLYGQLKMEWAMYEALLAQGNDEQVLALWRTLPDPRAVNDACAVCLRVGSLLTGIRLVFDQNTCFSAWLRGEFTPINTPQVFELVKCYFQAFRDDTRLQMWSKRLALPKTPASNLHMMLALESLEEWRTILKRIHHWAVSKLTFYKAFVAGGTFETAEGQALLFFLRDQIAELKNALANLPMTAANAPLFLLEDSLEAALSFSAIESLSESTVGNCPALSLKLAHTAESRQLYGIAAVFYLQAEAQTEAARCYESAREYEPLGHLYIQMGQPLKAVEVFLQMASLPHRRIAQAYQKANEWQKALEHYTLAGDGRGRRYCLISLHKAQQCSPEG